MREIKFRGKREHDGEWVYGVPIFFPDESVYLVTIGCFRLDKTIITPSTLGQYTGFKDKNGKEIYEGDVCVFDIFNTLEIYPDVNPYESYLVVIERKYGSWGFRFLYPELVNEDDAGWKPFWNEEDKELWSLKYFRVVSNVHDNPELLEARGQEDV